MSFHWMRFGGSKVSGDGGIHCFYFWSWHAGPGQSVNNSLVPHGSNFEIRDLGGQR